MIESWVSSPLSSATILLVVYVGVIGLIRGVTELLLAFKLMGMRTPPMAIA